MNATALPPLSFPKPSSSRRVYISCVNGSAYLNAMYGLWGAVSGETLSSILHISVHWSSDHFRIGDPPPIEAYCFCIFGVRLFEIRGPR